MNRKKIKFCDNPECRNHVDVDFFADIIELYEKNVVKSEKRHLYLHNSTKIYICGTCKENCIDPLEILRKKPSFFCRRAENK